MTVEYQQWDIVSSVGLTALAVAAGRALEANGATPLVKDSFAEQFVHAANPPEPLPTRPDDADGPVWGQMATHMALRTRFLDDVVLEAKPSQLVILAAGLDVRAHRLALPPNCRVFEVDQPKVLEFKQQVLDAEGAEPACARTAVPTDLRDDWVSALRESGFDPDEPSVWLAEGLLPYLPGRAEEELFDRIHALSAPGSALAVQVHDGDFTAMFEDSFVVDTAQALGVDLQGLFSTEPRRDPGEWLRWAGWATTETGAAELEQRYDRPLPEDGGTLARANRFLVARR
ncbi:SAM-dependent methyltransferase [Sciscionella marina]|uniref:SAM-dependent methyltransferase n=1 Tax=Sciscionella marina TaxID=508770 RepID=UPI00038289C9|nr:SAM-dependent methyltransferase [Sciscionella marina]